jgi:pyridoxine 5-phosphate synthase
VANLAGSSTAGLAGRAVLGIPGPSAAVFVKQPALQPASPGRHGGNYQKPLQRRHLLKHLRLGLNIDHVATIRNARGGRHPDPVRAAKLAAQAGADGITAHLREDRRHISDRDIDRLSREIDLPLNLEMAATEEMLAIALRHKPHAACLVPEKREERTTEGGLDVRRGFDHLAPYVHRLVDAGIRVSLFIEPDAAQIEAARAIGAPVVEFHTGAYCEAEGPAQGRQLERLVAGAARGVEVGLECHAGHGLTYDTVGPVAAIATLAELNIGHFLIGEAIFGGLESAIRRMRALMDKARGELSA